MTARHRFPSLLRSLAVVGAAAAALAGLPAGSAISGERAASVAPVLGAVGKVIPEHYLVVFNDGLRDAHAEAARIAADTGAKINFVYESALKGLAGRFTADQLLLVRANPNVAYVEPDTVYSIDATQSPATWGLDRIDQRDRPLNNSYTYNTTASGVHAYIVDTGIRLTHQQFTGRIGNGYDAVTAGGNANDCNGHGTHVAGTTGGSTYGVAKGVTLHPVRVLNCLGSGSNSGVIAGIDWVRANHVKPAVANMSLGGGASSTLDTAVTNAINAGVTFAVAAGNDNANACNYSPARVAAAITVGSTTSSDARSSFSNYGSCLDIFAPGSQITSAWSSSDTATNTIDGTSMASPHVAGVAALAVAATPAATPAQVRDTIVTSGSTGKLTSIGTGSPNVLLYSLLGAAPPPPPPPPPPPGGTFVNPGFESGPGVGWAQSSSGGYTLITADRPRTGSYSAWMGGYNYATEYLHQTVTVPSTGNTMSYYWRMETTETTTTTVYDYMEVRLYDGSTGSLLATPRRWSNLSTRNAWSLDTISLSAYAGRSIQVRFYTRTDSSLTSSFFVDDTSIA